MFNILTCITHGEYKVQVHQGLGYLSLDEHFDIVETREMESFCEKIVFSDKNWKAVAIEDFEDTLQALKNIADQINHSTAVVVFQEDYYHLVERIGGHIVHKVSRNLPLIELAEIMVGSEYLNVA